MTAPTANVSTSPRAIWNLTWPQLMMMYFIFFIGLTDIWTAGRLSGDVQAALGMITQCITFLQVVSMALSSGALSCISQSLGAGRLRRACRYVSATLLGVAMLGLLAGLVALLFSDGLFALLLVPESLRPLTAQLWAIFMYALPANYLYTASGMLFRATRQVLPPLWVGGLGCVVNFFGDLGFGLGYFGLPAYGAAGIAWTSFACIWLCALGNCLLLLRSGFLRLDSLPVFRWLKAGAPYLLKVAGNAGAAQLVWHSGYMALFVLVASLPVDSVNALAGLTAGLRVEAMLFMPAMAVHMSAAVIVGNLLGAGNAARAHRLGLWLVGAGALVMSCVAAAIWPFRQELAALLAQDAGVQAQAVSYLEYNLLSTPFSVASTIMSGIMTGAGATRYNLMIYGSTFWFVRLPLAFLLGHHIWKDAAGVFAAMLISQVIQTSLMLRVVLRGRWMRFAMKKTQATGPYKE